MPWKDFQETDGKGKQAEKDPYLLVLDPAKRLLR